MSVRVTDKGTQPRRLAAVQGPPKPPSVEEMTPRQEVTAVTASSLQELILCCHSEELKAERLCDLMQSWGRFI